VNTSFDPMQSASVLGSFSGASAFRLGTALLTRPDIDHILPAITAALRKLMPHDYAAIVFQDENADGHLRLRELSSNFNSGSIHLEELPLELTPASWVLTNQRILLLSRCDPGQLPDPRDYLQSEIKYGCWIPLVRRGETIGVLFVGSRHDAQLEQRVIDLLGPSAQVAGALEIAENVQDAVDLSSQLREEKAYLEEQLSNEWRFENVIGMSSGFRDVMERVRKLGPGHETVLIIGENGTEKELIARLIHQLSPHHHRTFVKVNCGGYPAHILAKKLFGYEKTGMGGGAVRRMGRLELAHLSTLFLEEVADLPTELQSRLVLAIKEKGLAQPEGQARVSLDIRLLASTSRDLSVLANPGKFNGDLYQLLTVCPMELLPLRNRSGDIPLLVNHFVGKFARQMKKTIHTIPQETMSALCAGQWPGNLRELENFIERAVMLTPGSTLRAPLVELEALYDESLQAAERNHILRVLRDSKGVIGGPGGAAKRLGVKRTTLNSKLKKLGIQREAYA
jgi:formate hydrogenlyase transcriptional activator